MVKTTCKSNSGHALVQYSIFWLPYNDQIACEKPWHPTCDSQTVWILHICKYIQGEACLRLPSTRLTACYPFNFALSNYSSYLWLTSMDFPRMWVQMRLFILSTETSNWCKYWRWSHINSNFYFLAYSSLDTWKDKKLWLSFLTFRTERRISETQCSVDWQTSHCPLLIATTRATVGCNALMGSAVYMSLFNKYI